MADNPRLEELRRRVQSDPASIAFAALAEEYRRAGRFDEAIATCAAGLKRHPSYLSAHVTLGRSLIEVGQYDEAREELEFVLRAAPENLAAIRGLAEIHHRLGDSVYAPEDPTPEGAKPVPARVPMPQWSPAVSAAEPIPTDPSLAALEAFLAAVRQARTAARP
ncbi:MAG: tetratricopeptide repeat protein [Vicinamibacterales bacterium]